MPHQVHQRKFGRETAHRRSMLRNLTLSVLRYERVRTTEAKAKEVRGLVDRMINLGKDGSLEARRRAAAWLPETQIVEKVFSDLAQRYPDRRSGYLRMVRLRRRVGDSAPLMLLELVPAGEDGATRTAGETAEAEKPRRRLRIPRRRAAAEGGEAEPAKRTTRKKTATTATKKKTAKG